MTVLRAGVVGAGRAAVLHLDVLAAMPDVEVVAVADVDEGAARRAAASYGIPRVATSAAELLREPVDVVHSCVANVAHAEVAEQVLEAGRHIVAEKPLALSSVEAARLAELAERAGVHAYVCFTRRHLPAVIHMREEVAASPGGPHLARGGYFQDWLLARSSWDWRLDPSLSGASATLADLGSHFLDLLEHVAGSRVTSILATLGRLHEERDVGQPPTPRRVELEDHALLLARLANGARVSGTLSQVSAGWNDHLFLELSLRERTLAWSYDEPEQLRVGARGGGFAGESFGPVPPADTTAFRWFLPEVYTAIRGGEPAAPPATFADGWHSVQLVESALESDRSGCWTAVPELVPE
jgi:predicted dehydrogenase